MSPMSDHETTSVPVPLRERLPDYLVIFAIGLVVAVVVGGVISAASTASLADGIGYTIILLGVVFLLAGGATGGGYTSLGMGAVGAMFGARRLDEDDGIDSGPGSRGEAPDPYERLRRGLRPEANPRAFWQVIAGIAYVAIGLLVVIRFGVA